MWSVQHVRRHALKGYPVPRPWQENAAATSDQITWSATLLKSCKVNSTGEKEESRYPLLRNKPKFFTNSQVPLSQKTRIHSLIPVSFKQPNACRSALYENKVTNCIKFYSYISASISSLPQTQTPTDPPLPQ
jgi:hypothetical protein